MCTDHQRASYQSPHEAYEFIPLEMNRAGQSRRLDVEDFVKAEAEDLDYNPNNPLSLDEEITVDLPFQQQVQVVLETFFNGAKHSLNDFVAIYVGRLLWGGL